MRSIRFFVGGKPVTQGSKRLVRGARGRTLMIEASRNLKPWRSAVARAAVAAGVRMIDGDVEVGIVALWERPASHYRKDGSIRPSMPTRPRYADCDKMCRAICDALAKVAYENDRSVACLSIERRWAESGERMGAIVEIREAIPHGCWKFCEQAAPPARA
jgi:crossover junction endodeoxyribonuclease RusA